MQSSESPTAMTVSCSCTARRWRCGQQGACSDSKELCGVGHKTVCPTQPMTGTAPHHVHQSEHDLAQQLHIPTERSMCQCHRGPGVQMKRRQPPSTCSTHHQMQQHCSSAILPNQQHIPCTLLAPTASTCTWMPRRCMRSAGFGTPSIGHTRCMFGRFRCADTHSKLCLATTTSTRTHHHMQKPRMHSARYRDPSGRTPTCVCCAGNSPHVH